MSDSTKAVQIDDARVTVWREHDDADTDGPVIVIVDKDDGTQIDVPVSDDAHEHFLDRFLDD